MKSHKNYRQFLFNELTTKLNLEELKNLCFFLKDWDSKLAYDLLQGETLEGKVRALLEYVHHREALNSWGALYEIFENKFPHVDASWLEAVRVIQQGSRIGLMREALRTGRRADVLSAWRLFKKQLITGTAEEIWLEVLVVIIEMGAWTAVTKPEHQIVLQKCQQEWPNEVVGALLASGLLLNPAVAKEPAILSFLANLPLHLLTDVSLQERFAEARTTQLGQLQDRFKGWPVLRPLNLRIPPLAPSFWLTQAEAEYATLHEKEHFWRGHPVYQSLREQKFGGHQVVLAEEGSGRTAVAQAFYAQQAENNILTVYVDKARTLQQIGAEMANHLWEYLKHKPLLLPFHKDEYRLLAKVLSSGGIRHGALAVRQEMRDERWLNGIRDEAQRRVWRDVGQMNLSRLQQAFSDLEYGSYWMGDDWAGWLVDYAHAVGLVMGAAQVRLVLDSSELGPELAEELAEGGRDWQRAGVQIFLFLPLTEYAPDLLPWQTHRLEWRDEQIQTLIAYRLAKFRGEKSLGTRLERVANERPWSGLWTWFDPEAWDMLIQAAQGSPRLAAQLCAELPITSAREQAPITVELVKQARARVKEYGEGGHFPLP